MILDGGGRGTENVLDSSLREMERVATLDCIARSRRLDCDVILHTLFTRACLPDAAAAAAAAGSGGGGNYTAAVTDDQPHRPPLLRGWCRLILSGSDSHLLSIDHFMDVELAIRLVRLPADPLIGNSTHTHTHTHTHTYTPV